MNDPFKASLKTDTEWRKAFFFQQWSVAALVATTVVAKLARLGRHWLAVHWS